jgi:PEP-CTERM motif-containing protein
MQINMAILVLLLVLIAAPAAADSIVAVPSGGCGTVLHDDKIIVHADRQIRTALFWATEATCGATLETPLPSITFMPAEAPGESFDYVVYGYQLPCSGRIQFDAAFDASFTDFAFVGVLGKNCTPSTGAIPTLAEGVLKLPFTLETAGIPTLGEGILKLPLTLETLDTPPEPYTEFTPNDPETNDPETPIVPTPVPEPSTLVLMGSTLVVLFRGTRRWANGSANSSTHRE